MSTSPGITPKPPQQITPPSPKRGSESQAAPKTVVASSKDSSTVAQGDSIELTHAQPKPSQPQNSSGMSFLGYLSSKIWVPAQTSNDAEQAVRISGLFKQDEKKPVEQPQHSVSNTATEKKVTSAADSEAPDEEDVEWGDAMEEAPPGTNDADSVTSSVEGSDETDESAKTADNKKDDTKKSDDTKQEQGWFDWTVSMLTWPFRATWDALCSVGSYIKSFFVSSDDKKTDNQAKKD